MRDWTPKLKAYPHFDAFLPDKEIKQIVNSPHRVAQNCFFPFIEYTKENRKFGCSDPKKRKIRYASRRDSYIYSYYRRLLLPKYEERLIEYNIQDCPIAYRKIPIASKSSSGKCNIHFAKEAFEYIRYKSNCFALTMDISSFFESLDHEKLYKLWCELLQEKKLPFDHLAVFKAITKYTIVDREEVYKKLGYKRGQNIPMQLCEPHIFRSKICDKSQSILKQNKANFGIPQGSPISDLLANLYLINFDRKISDLARKVEGYYRRYSDDILFICPYNKKTLQEVCSFIEKQIKNAGEKLEINSKKTNITEFFMQNELLKYKPYNHDKKNSKIMLNYLGFAFDGKRALIKNQTLSRYYRKMTFGVRKEAKRMVAKFPNATLEEIIKKLPFSMLCQKYGRIENFCNEKRNFWSYVNYSSEVFGEMGGHIKKQLRNMKHNLKVKLQTEIKKALQEEKNNKNTKQIKAPTEKS